MESSTIGAVNVPVTSRSLTWHSTQTPFVLDGPSSPWTSADTSIHDV